MRAKVVRISDVRPDAWNGMSHGKASAGKTPPDPGLGIVRRLYESAQIDPEFSVVTERGFTWWAHHYAQRIWADEPYERKGMRLTAVHAQTDFLRYPYRSEEYEYPLAVAMSHASLSGAVLCEDTHRIGLHCHVLVHDENVEFAEQLFNLAAFLQCCDVEFKAEALARELGLEPDPSDHPVSGPRPEMDDMLHFVDKVVISHGSQPFMAIGRNDLENAAAVLSEFNVVTNEGKGGIIVGGVDLNIGADGYPPGMLNLSVAEHPALGTGLLFFLRMDPAIFNRRGITVDGRLILDLNTWQAEHDTACHCLGSWCLDLLIEDEVNATWLTFVPAVLCTSNVLTNMALFTAGRGFSFVNFIQDRGL